MRRLSTFLLGAVVGAGLMYGGLKYHLVRANDGLHLVPKLTAELGNTYVDIRHFTWQDWQEHRDLALAMARSGDGELLRDAADAGLQRLMQSATELFRPRDEQR